MSQTSHASKSTLMNWYDNKKPIDNISFHYHFICINYSPYQKSLAEWSWLAVIWGTNKQRWQSFYNWKRHGTDGASVFFYSLSISFSLSLYALCVFMFFSLLVRCHCYYNMWKCEKQKNKLSFCPNFCCFLFFQHFSFLPSCVFQVETINFTSKNFMIFYGVLVGISMYVCIYLIHCLNVYMCVWEGKWMNVCICVKQTNEQHQEKSEKHIA